MGIVRHQVQLELVMGESYYMVPSTAIREAARATAGVPEDSSSRIQFRELARIGMFHFHAPTVAIQQ